MIDIQDMIDVAVEEWSEDKATTRDSEKFHISDAGLCYRSRYMKRLGIPSSRITPVGALKKMMAGEAGHEKLQSVLWASGALESAEGAVEPWHGVLGHYDGVAKDDDERVLLEFKTIEKFQMTHIKREGPKKEHILQMKSYWFGLKEQGTQNLNQASLIYVQREDFQQVSFNYLWDDDILKETQAEWQPLLRYWDQEKLPPCTCALDYGGNGVAYCRYQNPKQPDKCCDIT